MTEHDFIVWLNGFVDGVHEYNVTPKQWDTLKDKLAKVTDKSITPLPFEVPNPTPNTTSIWYEAMINGRTTNTTTIPPSGSMWTYTDTVTNHIK
jgi:hypothetical protein